MKRLFLRKLALPVISIVVVAVIALQASVSFLPWRSPSFPEILSRMFSPPTLWPFIDYPMYAAPHYKGDTISQVSLLGILEDSTTVTIVPEDLGLGFWHFRKHFINGLLRSDQQRVAMFVNLYQNRTSRRLVGLRLENHPLILAEDGIRPAAPEVLRTLRLDIR